MMEIKGTLRGTDWVLLGLIVLLFILILNQGRQISVLKEGVLLNQNRWKYYFYHLQEADSNAVRFMLKYDLKLDYSDSTGWGGTMKDNHLNGGEK